jgi:hypothetical protein
VFVCVCVCADVGEAFLVLFRVSTFSGWSDIARMCIASRSDTLAPGMVQSSFVLLLLLHSTLLRLCVILPTYVDVLVFHHPHPCPTVPEYRPYIALYFYAFLIIGAFFAINLFIGVVIDKFRRIKDEYEGSAFQTKEQKQWYATCNGSTARSDSALYSLPVLFPRSCRVGCDS